MSPLPNPQGSKHHVLVIDDEAPVRATLQRYLTMMGYDSTLAESGEAGLKALGSVFPDLVFLDVTMPGMDGMVTLRQLHEKYEHIRVIMLATPADIPKATLALNCGASDFINKPLDLPTVKRMLQIHLPPAR